MLMEAYYALEDVVMDYKFISLFSLVVLYKNIYSTLSLKSYFDIYFLYLQVQAFKLAILRNVIF